MKTLLTFAVLLMSTAALAQDASCTTLYHHGDRDILLCRAGDTFTRTDLTDSSASETVISEKTYDSLMAKDTAEEQAYIAQLNAAQLQREKNKAEWDAHHAAVMAATKINSKKQCTAAGYIWNHGLCSPKDGQ